MSFLFFVDHLEPTLGEEFIQFREFLSKNIIVPQGKSFELVMFENVMQSGVRRVFPNVCITLRIYLSMLVTNCSGERSFSSLKRIKTCLRNSMSDPKLNHLSLMAVESDLLRSLDFNEIIHNFAHRKARRATVS